MQQGDGIGPRRALRATVLGVLAAFALWGVLVPAGGADRLLERHALVLARAQAEALARAAAAAPPRPEAAVAGAPADPAAGAAALLRAARARGLEAVIYGPDGVPLAGGGPGAPPLPLVAPRAWAERAGGRAAAEIAPPRAPAAPSPPEGAGPAAPTLGAPDRSAEPVTGGASGQVAAPRSGPGPARLRPDAGPLRVRVHLPAPAPAPPGATLALAVDLGGTAAAAAARAAPAAAAGFGVVCAGLGLAAAARRAARGRADPLTGLPDRRAFLYAAGRSHEPGAVVVADVDRFREVNRRLGQAAGDALLARLGAALRGALRAQDPVGRLGADSLAARLHLPQEEELPAILTRLSDRLAAAAAEEAGAAAPRLSFGAALLPAGPGGLDVALRHAEIALAEAKAEGGGRVRVFAPAMESRLARRLRIEAALETGLDEGRFRLAFQPLVSPIDRAARGYEALLRLEDVDGAPIPPAEFIPLAEETGRIEALGAWVLHEAARIAAGWSLPLGVSVNLSVHQFRDGRLVETVRAALAESGLDPRRLELEVTESLVIRDPETVRRQLEELRALGVGVAMDDFGAGHSSLAQLWRFRFDRLKLDRAFVQALCRDEPRARDVVAAVIALGHRLGMRVTAEGIETEAQARALADLGCDALQGYRFGAPVDADALAELMRWSADAAAEAGRRAPPARPPATVRAC